ncbi:MAG: hypothetical protein RMJ87_14165, partial [Cytophagales bacterium]|nr:hypothetical protein [Cytophagales bacterium]
IPTNDHIVAREDTRNGGGNAVVRVLTNDHNAVVRVLTNNQECDFAKKNFLPVQPFCQMEGLISAQLRNIHICKAAVLILRFFNGEFA